MSSPIKPMPLARLKQYKALDRVIVESLEQALYRVTVEVDGQRYFVTESAGKSLIRRSKLDILVLFRAITVGETFLKHTSPYDEMIGMQDASGLNELLVPLGNYYTHDPDETFH